MLIYICDSLNTTDPGGPCDDVSEGLSSCLRGTLIAAWAVGAQVMKFGLSILILLDTCRILFFLPILHTAWEVTSTDMQ